jgi:hypothetical protein
MIRSGSVAVLLTLPLALTAAVQAAPCSGYESELTAGAADSFAPPFEPTYQSPAFEDFLVNVWYPHGQGARVFDETGIDRALAHSFTGLGTDICAASLEFRVRADGSLSDNDSIRLAYTGNDTVADGFVYWVTLRLLTGSTWLPGSDRVFTLDLANLPVYGGFPTNILSELQDGELEILVEDDTSVDYAVLRVCTCPVSVDDVSWGRVKAKYGAPSR